MKIEFVHQRKVIHEVDSVSVPYVSEIVNMAKKGDSQQPYLVSNRIWHPIQNKVEVFLMKMGEG